MNFRLAARREKCSGCRACQLACSEAHGDGFNPARSRMFVIKDDASGNDLPITCRFCKNTCNKGEVLDWDETAELLAAATGDPWTGESVRQAGERIVNTERMINARFGIDRRHDTLPKRFLEETAGPANSPSAGSVVELEHMLDEYYAAREWSLVTGLPSESKLKELGLGD